MAADPLTAANLGDPLARASLPASPLCPKLGGGVSSNGPGTQAYAPLRGDPALTTANGFRGGSLALLMNQPERSRDPEKGGAAAGHGSGPFELKGSLAELMSQHDQNRLGSRATDCGTAPGSRPYGLGSLSLGLSSSPGTCSLALGALAPLGCPAPGSSPLLSSLGSLSLADLQASGPIGMPPAPPGFAGPSPALRSSPIDARGGGSDHKGSPSLADLMQEHKHSSPVLYSSLPSVQNQPGDQAPYPPSGLPPSGLPSSGLPSSGLPSSGLPSSGLPSSGLPPSGLLSSELPPSGLLSSGLPPSGLPSSGLMPLSQSLRLQSPGLPALSALASKHEAKTWPLPETGSLSSLLLGDRQGGAGVGLGLSRGGRLRGPESEAPAFKSVSPRAQPSSNSSARPCVDLSVLVQPDQSAASPAGRADGGAALSPSSPRLRGDPCRRSVFARPSVFALALAVRSPGNGRRARRAGGHRAFLYAKQMQLVKAKEQGPLHDITPFHFQSPSPDDVVKANQKKAFTRD